MYSDAAALENRLIIPQMIGHKVTYDTILYLQSQEMEVYVHTKICTQMFKAVFLIMCNKLKEFKYKSANESIHKHDTSMQWNNVCQ